MNQESDYLRQRRAIMMGEKQPEPKVTSKPLAQKSKKLTAKEKEYKKIVAEMLAQDNRCELTTPDCTGTAEGLHHQKGRGIHLTNRKYLKRACNSCNGYVDRHPQYAIDNGLSVSRLANNS